MHKHKLLKSMQSLLGCKLSACKGELIFLSVRIIYFHAY